MQFRVTTLDVGVPEEAEQIVALAESLAPVGGVFHLAMYLADKLVTNQARALISFLPAILRLFRQQLEFQVSANCIRLKCVSICPA